MVLFCQRCFGICGWVGAGMLLHVQPMYRCEHPVLRLHALFYTALERVRERALFLSLEVLHCDGLCWGRCILRLPPAQIWTGSASCNPRLQARLPYIACTLLTPGPLLYIFHHPCPLLDQVQGCCWSTQVQSKLGALGPHSPGGGLLLYTLLAAGVGMSRVVSCLAACCGCLVSRLRLCQPGWWSGGQHAVIRAADSSCAAWAATLVTCACGCGTVSVVLQVT